MRPLGGAGPARGRGGGGGGAGRGAGGGGARRGRGWARAGAATAAEGALFSFEVAPPDEPACRWGGAGAACEAGHPEAGLNSSDPEAGLNSSDAAVAAFLDGCAAARGGGCLSCPPWELFPHATVPPSPPPSY